MRLSNIIYLTIAFQLVGFFEVNAQKSKNQLEKEKISFQKQINETQQILSETTDKKKASVA